MSDPSMYMVVMYGGPPLAVPVEAPVPAPFVIPSTEPFVPFQGPSQEQVRHMIEAEVARALRDPARIAEALMRLPPEIRNSVRALLDALEAAGHDGSEP